MGAAWPARPPPLRWAWAAAARAGGADPRIAEPDIFDRSTDAIQALRPHIPAQILPEYCDIPLGAVLAFADGRRDGSGVLLTRFRALPARSHSSGLAAWAFSGSRS